MAKLDEPKPLSGWVLELIGWAVYLPHVAIWLVLAHMLSSRGYLPSTTAMLVTALIEVPLLAASMWCWVWGVLRLRRSSAERGKSAGLLIGLIVYVPILAAAVGLGFVLTYMVLTGKVG